MSTLALDYSPFIAPVTRERLRLIEELAPQFRSAGGRARRHYETCLVDLFLGNGAEVQITEHVGLRIGTRVHIEGCDMESAVWWMANVPRDALKDAERYANVPVDKLPGFDRPGSDRVLRVRLLKFYEQNCKPHSCPFIGTWFVIEDLRAGSSA